jgi:hypothetical protein
MTALPVPAHAAGTTCLRLGSQLDQLNMARAQMGRRHVDPSTPGGARWVMNLAYMDARRRVLRIRLAAALAGGA